MVMRPAKSFAEVLNELDDGQIGKSALEKTVPASPQPIINDSLELSARAARRLAAPKDGQRQVPDTRDSGRQATDTQGNRVLISTRGDAMARTTAENVAWETRLKSRETAFANDAVHAENQLALPSCR